MREDDNQGKFSKQQLIKTAIDFAKEGRWQEAITVNQQILQLIPQDVDAHNRLGKAYVELGEYVHAKEAYKKSLELDPANNIAKRNLRKIIPKIPKSTSPQTSESPQKNTTETDGEPLFDISNRVRIRETKSIGVVTSILPNRQYQIFLNENEQPIVSEKDLEAVTVYPRFVTPQEFLRDLLIFKLKRPLSDTLYSYSMSRTNFEVYQFKPAIKFLNSPNGRILIADEVGLGKTIEACIIYLELKTRMQGDLPRVLIVCPAGLRNKWQSELTARFGEEFTLLGTNQLRQFFSEYETAGPAKRLRGICSIEALRREELCARIVESGVQFDLVVIDEAHHMRNPDTLSFDLGETLSEHSDSLLLLTATPVHLQSLDLYYLLNILDPGQFESPELFEYQLEPNRLLNVAISKLWEKPPDTRIARTRLDSCPQYIKENPLYKGAIELIERIESGENGTRRDLIAAAVRNLNQLNTFSLVFNRTRRKDVSRGSLRNAKVIDISLTPLEEEIYSESLKFARAKARYMRGYVSVLGLIQIERQIASSLGAFREIIEQFNTDGEFDATVESSSSELEDNSISTLPREETLELCGKIQNLFNMLGGVDSKFDEFHRELSQLLSLNPPAKVIVFSFFRRTLAYLYRRLTKEGHKVDVIHGGVDIRERHRIIDRFSEESERRILLSSEVGAEGLDLQFCDTIINYDLPWNPMRVEQRIGRIDRYGQKSDKIRIFSLFINGTIEQRILSRLYTRIGIFEESIGALEPILGDIVRELSKEILSNELTPEQEEKKTDEFLMMLENRRLETEEFEEHRYELMGQDTIFSQQIEDNIDSGRFVSAKEIRALVSSYISNTCPKTSLQEVDLALDNWALSPDHSLVDNLRSLVNSKTIRPEREDWRFLGLIQNRLTPGGRLFSTGSRGIPITFSSDLAMQRPLLEFINISHPMVKLAYYSMSPNVQTDPETRMLKFKMKDELGSKSGIYYFFLFYLSARAIINSDELVTVVSDTECNIDNDLSARFLKIIQDCLSEDTLQSDVVFDQEIFNQVKSRVIESMSDIRNQREIAIHQRNEGLIAIRRVAIEKTFDVKKRRAEARLQKATNDRIIRMHQGELRNLESKLQNSIKELERKKQVTVSYEPVAYGLMELEGNN